MRKLRLHGPNQFAERASRKLAESSKRRKLKIEDLVGNKGPIVPPNPEGPSSVQEMLRKIVAGLNEQEREVLKMRFADEPDVLKQIEEACAAGVSFLPSVRRP